MLNLNDASLANGKLLGFFKQYPMLSTSLLTKCGHNIQEVTTIIEPVLTAQERRQTDTYFIHGVSLGHTAFLATNLSHEEQKLHATETATSWLVGRTTPPGINIPEPTISRCHAVIGHQAYDNFFVTDVGSRNGTWVNGDRLPPHTRRVITNGDMLQFGQVTVEFLSTQQHQGTQPDVMDITYS